MTDCFTRDSVVSFLLESMEWHYRDRAKTTQEKKILDDIRAHLATEQPKQEHFAILAIACKDKEIDRLTDENEALRRDAELGRWIREETPPIEEIAARVDAMEDER